MLNSARAISFDSAEHTNIDNADSSNAINSSIFSVPRDYSTIQDGINAANYGDIVLVASGTFTEQVIMKSGVTVRGTGGSLSTPNDPSDDSIIDSGGANYKRTVSFHGTQDATLEGFTITNGRGSRYGGNITCSGTRNTIKENLIINGKTTSYGGYGGGIYLGCDNARVINNVIKDNWAWYHGGGIDINGKNALVEGNFIFSNQADWAGGISVRGSSAVIRKNIIIQNFADHRNGGGLLIYSSASSATIENNTIIKNIAKSWGYGGAIYVQEVNQIAILNNIIANNLNTSSRTGGIHFVSCPTLLTLTYNDVFNNQGSNYAGCTPEEGSISVDPMFVDATTDDYHLQAGSPAIDAGDPDSAYNDLEDPDNLGFALPPGLGTVRNDLGAYGGTDTLQTPDLSSSIKSASSHDVQVGDIISYTFILRNDSHITALATLTDTIPIDTEYINNSAQADGGNLSVTNNQLIWTGYISYGSPAHIQFAVKVLDIPASATITNVAQLNDGAGQEISLTAISRVQSSGYWLTVNNGGLYTRTPSVTLCASWSTSDQITDVQFSNDGGFQADNSSEWIDVAQMNPPFCIEEWVLDTHSTFILPRISYARFRSNNQIIGTPVQDDIIYDPVLPEVLNAEIVDIHSNTTAQSLNAVNSTIRVWAIDSLSGVSKVQLSHTKDFESFSTFDFLHNPMDVSWNLPVSGLVYARVVDYSGNISYAICAGQCFIQYLPFVSNNK